MIKELEKRDIVLQKVTNKSEIFGLISKLHPLKSNARLIRLGPNGDGGYLVPDDLVNIEACFSPGVDAVSQFEYDCYNRGMKIFMADNSVKKPNLNLPTEEYDFVQKHIGIINNDELITMDNWVGEKTKSKESDLLLQMDIEGFEYQALLNISDTLLKRFRIMVIEFHYLNEFWNPRFFEIAKAVFEKILNSHACVHIHPNNCCGVDKRFGMEIPSVAEFTFYRKDKISSLVYETKFPNPLDFDNTNKKSIFLPKIWYSNN